MARPYSGSLQLELVNGRQRRIQAIPTDKVEVDKSTIRKPIPDESTVPDAVIPTIGT